jgi:hypothetical protein
MNSTLSISTDSIQFNKQESGQTTIHIVSPDSLILSLETPVSISSAITTSSTLTLPEVLSNSVQAYGTLADVNLTLSSKGAGDVEIDSNTGGILLTGDVVVDPANSLTATTSNINSIQAFAAGADEDVEILSKGAGTINLTGNVELQGTATITATSGVLTNLISPSTAGPFFAVPTYADNAGCEAVLATISQGVRWFNTATGKICFSYNNGGAFIHDPSA